MRLDVVTTDISWLLERFLLVIFGDDRLKALPIASMARGNT